MEHSGFGKMLDDLLRDAGGPGFFWQLGGPGRLPAGGAGRSRGT